MSNRTRVTNTNFTGEYIGMDKECYKELVKLSKKAFRDVGKDVAKEIRGKVGGRGYARKGVTAKVELTKDTGNEPCLMIGFKKQSKMKDKVPFYINPSWYEDGTQAHSITRKKKSALSDGTIIYGRSVVHTGSRANHIVRDTIKGNQTKIVESIKSNLAKIDGINVTEGDTNIEETEEELL